MTGLEALLPEAIKAMTGLFLKTIWGIDYLNKPIGELFNSNSPKDYVESYLNLHGQIKSLGMKEAVPLKEIYVDVQLIDDSRRRRWEEPEELEKVFRERGRADSRWDRQYWVAGQAERRMGLEVVNEKPYLMVLGGPGIGKSTFLKRAGLAALLGKGKDGFQHECLPVFIELKQFRGRSFDLEAVIREELSIFGFKQPEDALKKMLTKGKFLILLDGLDELPTDEISQMIPIISKMVVKFPKNRYITSCRSAAYRLNLTQFQDVEVAAFSDLQIERFVSNWFRHNPSLADSCLKHLKEQDNQTTKELAHTPLLLIFMCLQYQKAGHFPAKRATLYENAMRILLEEWQASKEIPYEMVYKGLDTKAKEELLAEVAYTTFREDRLFLTTRELAKEIERILKEILREEKSIDGHKILRSIEVQHGVLVERFEDYYTFSHLTLQEFFTALYIAEGDDALLQEVINRHFSDSRWREVFLMVVGLKRADSILPRMAEKTQSLLTAKIEPIVAWANTIIPPDLQGAKAAARRAVALFLYLDRALDHSLDRGLSLYRARARDLSLYLYYYLDHSLDLDLDLDRPRTLAPFFPVCNFTNLISELEGIKPEALSIQEFLTCHRRIEDLRWQTLQVPPDLRRRISDQARRDLEVYLAANLLFTDCYQNAVRVTPAVWDDICGRMLTPHLP